jgi:hypothetical protein
MTNDGIFAINASIITDENIWLADIDDHDDVQTFFTVICKSDDEWHLMIDRGTLQHYLDKKNDERPLQYRAEIEVAEMLNDRVNEISASRKLTRDQVLELTWVW